MKATFTPLSLVSAPDGAAGSAEADVYLTHVEVEGVLRALTVSVSPYSRYSAARTTDGVFDGAGAGDLDALVAYLLGSFLPQVPSKLTVGPDLDDVAAPAVETEGGQYVARA